MPHTFLETERLSLVLESTDAVLARIAALPAEFQADVSPEWLSRLRAAPEPSLWTHGVALIERKSGTTVGSAAFKGPPDSDAAVEIAYELELQHRGCGYAREAADSLCTYALTIGGAACVRAHTRADNPASARVLTACGFTYVGDVVDPDDGLVQRWERKTPHHANDKISS